MELTENMEEFLNDLIGKRMPWNPGQAVKSAVPILPLRCVQSSS